MSFNKNNWNQLPQNKCGRFGSYNAPNNVQNPTLPYSYNSEQQGRMAPVRVDNYACNANNDGQFVCPPTFNTQSAVVDSFRSPHHFALNQHAPPVRNEFTNQPPPRLLSAGGNRSYEGSGKDRRSLTDHSCLPPSTSYDKEDEYDKRRYSENKLNVVSRRETRSCSSSSPRRTSGSRSYDKDRYRSGSRHERNREDRPRYDERKRSRRISPNRVSSRYSKEEGSNSNEDPCDRTADEENASEEATWMRSSPADLYFVPGSGELSEVVATERMITLTERFNQELVQRGTRIRSSKPKYERPARKVYPCKKHSENSSSSSTSSSDDDDEKEEDGNKVLEEMESKKRHPDRLHEELWYNDPGEMNDGPLCRCSLKASRSGIRHSIYPGESRLLPCQPNSNNSNKLFHYRITMSPHTNFVTKKPTVVKHDGHEFIFEGFSLLSHYRLRDDLPPCKVIRFNIEYTIMYVEEKIPDNFTVASLELFSEFLFKEVLELVDLEFRAHEDKGGCPRFHLMPRFVRGLEDNGKEILSMNRVLSHFLSANEKLVDESKLERLLGLSTFEWQKYTDDVIGMIATYPGKKPCSIRVDQLDRESEDADKVAFPEIVHFGIRPPQLSYAGSPSYQKAWREYVKFRHLLANKPKVCYSDRNKLQQQEAALQDMRSKNNLKRDVTVAVSSLGFYRTGIMCDVVQHSMFIPFLVCHLRFHKSLDSLEEKLDYQFNDRYSLQLALTHPSYRENFGMNPDHARNSLTNCGMRQPEYGDRRIHFVNTRKRGISTLINIMSRFGQNEETTSSINHNERLEFLGDAVVEFITSIHLFHMFPELEEGGLATYRAAIVQNQHLAVLAKHLELEKYMLFAHGSDLCHDLELRHAMANCFEAVMGALFLDGGIEVSDTVFSKTLFPDDQLHSIWVNYPQHVLQEQEPNGDRKWIESVPLLQKLTKFEDSVGIEFKHIRLLARSFTMRSLGYNHLTLGSNQRLEFLGDTVLQLIASEYLYKFFPDHHEGHLSLLRSSLVNNRTQSVVCEDVGMVEYAINSSPKSDLKMKDKADLLEAFLGALYVDKGLDHCKCFCQVCFFPRLQDFILNQDWNDPKSKLQQCCLTLRSMKGGEPDIPVYKVIETKGPTNTRIYIVAVYFRGRRLAKGSGHSIQQAEMDAANNALASSKELFPQLVHQKRVIDKSTVC